MALQFGGFDAQPFRDRLGQGFGGVVERQVESGEAKHSGPLAGKAICLKFGAIRHAPVINLG